ncbi:MAG: iron-sulfur cluster repair di-iron protein [Chitinophagaceae bacterium]|nr:iron-sulfur cluster repair di-iron protein [Chitinophagaceae bacterium]
MNDLMTKSLAQIVNNNHRAAMVFEKYHLDFCCKGKRSLQEACTEKELKIEEVISELQTTEQVNSSSSDVDYNRLSLAQLSEYIVLIHHSFVKKESPAILGYLQKVASKHGDRHPEMIKVLQLFTAVKEEMEHHMQKEELVLFPRIKEVEKIVNEGKEIIINHTYLLSPINMMEQEHDHAGSLLAEIRNLTDNFTPPVDACTTYRLIYAALEAFELDLHRHVHLENNILFPKALKLFNVTNSCSLN